MEEPIEKRCQHCGMYFTSKRNDKKYCSDTCRQMAYFKRNGLSLVGKTSSLEKENVKYSSSPDNNITEQEAVKRTSLNPETDIEQLINRLSDTWEQRFNQQIEKLKQELDVKYGKEPAEELHGSKELKESESYEYITSHFVKYIEQEFYNDDDGYKLEKPTDYWTQDAIQVIQWVNLRLKCLLDSLIKLSSYARIDQHTMDCICDAFGRLQKSKAFKYLPANYPFKELIRKVLTKIETYCIRSKKSEKIIIRIPLKEKAQLIYTRHILQKTTPSVKFSELHFNE